MSRTSSTWLVAAIAASAFAGCCANSKTVSLKNVEVSQVPASEDPLGPRPQLGPAVAFRATQPEAYQTPAGIKVWLVPRPEPPMVSLSISLASGSADDPPGKAGLAHITTSMLDEGAGDRDAIAISTAIEDLGASLGGQVSHDGSRVSLTVLKKYLPEAFAIFADVVARPRFDAKEWVRVSALWQNRLRRRADSASSVAGVVSRALMYGPDTPYGHPAGGLLDTAKSMQIEDLRAFYKEHWRPDRARLVVAGAISRAELDALIAKHLSSWSKPTAAALAPVGTPEPLASRPKVVLVDRANAPQAVISVLLPGVRANSTELPLLELLNTALGGSFTSRLNQNLREDRGWSYGAGSAFSETRGKGIFVARSAVPVKVAAAALREMLRELNKMRTGGLTPQEYQKVRARDLTELIETNETLGHVVSRLTSLAILGLPPNHDAKASAARQASTMALLGSLAKTHLDVDQASIVIVGPKDHLLTQLKTLDLGEPSVWSAEGYPIANEPPAATPPAESP